VAELAPRHLAIERVALELEPGGHALDDRDQPRAVRFARCREVQGHTPRLWIAPMPQRAGGCRASFLPAFPPMAARRLLIVMLVLLGISILGGALLPSQRARDRNTTTQSTQETTIKDTLPRGDLLMRTIEVSAKKQFVIPVNVGDQLLLAVRSRQPDEVEIPSLGLIEAVDRFTPARFDILATEPGSHPIRLVAAELRVGRVLVRD